MLVWIPLAILLVEGFVTISAEIITIRQLMPVVGNSVVVTSLIIGVFLLFLALGYQKGGKYTSNFKKILKRNFLIASIFLGVGLSYLFVELFFSSLSKLLPLNSLIALSIYLLLIISPLVYLLGQTVPVTMNLIKINKEHKGALGGKVLFLSTIGSFFGAVLTTLIFMNYLGVAKTVFFNFLCLLTLFFVLVFEKDKLNFSAVKLLLVSFLFVLVYMSNIDLENKIFVKTNAYSNFSIEKEYVTNDKIKGKALIINNSLSSITTDDNKGFWYIETIKKILFDDLNYKNKNFLILGAGGFTLSLEKDNDNKFTYIDIDKDLPTVVKTHYMDKVNGDVKILDARRYLNSTNKQYDVIVSDAYGSKVSIPMHLITKEHFSLINKKIKDDGLAIFNIIANPTLSDEYSQNLDFTLRSVFAKCMSIPQKYSEQKSNIVYICKKNLKFNSKIYSDNLNTSQLDYVKAK